MAKSRVLQILEYDDAQRQNLARNLKAKNINSTQGESLGSLVEKVNSINLSLTAPQYERDPNFPDIDTLFDKDTLRLANGGQYKCCSYSIHRLTEDNRIKIFEVYNASYEYFPKKMVISDGKEYTNITATINEEYTVQESGIFVGEDGFKYCMVIIYADELDFINGSKITPSGLCEIVNDRTCFVTSFRDYTITPDTNPPVLRYYRFAGTNNTKELLDEKATAASYSVSVGANYVVLEGVLSMTTLYSSYAHQILDFNCEIYVPVNTSTILTMTIGDYSTSYESISNRVDVLKIPYSEKPLAIRAGYAPTKLIIPDNVYSYNQYATSNSINNINDLHIGNGLNSWGRRQGNSVYAFNPYGLKNVTVSEGAWGINTTAVTIDFSYASNLTRESVLNLFNNLADRTGMTANVLKLHAFTKSLVTDEEKAILTNKNWTLS